MPTKIRFSERLTNFYRYPKICRFQDQIEDKDRFVSYLKNRHPGTKQVYIYIHIPFCTSTCNYCPFYHVYYHHVPEETRARFVEGVVKELTRYAEEPFFSQTPIVNINFGGGTPFLLDLKYLERILTTIYVKFHVVKDPVVSIEGDPIALQDQAKLRAVKSLGMTRASFGIQTLNERVRRKLSVQSAVSDIYRCVESLDKCGYDEWGCDMLYNCPEQNVTEIRFNVDRICELQPSIVDVYDLNISPNTRLSTLVTGNRFSSNPSNQKEIEQFKAIQETFAEHDFEQVRSVNFKPRAAPVQDHGILYQFSHDVLGIGPSARTFLYTAGRNYRNHCSIEAYIQDLENGEYPIEAGNEVPPAVLEERDLVLFPYYLQVRQDSLNYARFKDKIDDMIESGYVEQAGEDLRLTPLGRLWAGNVQYYFHTEEEKAAMAKSALLSLQHGTNLFNQDRINVVASSSPA